MKSSTVVAKSVQVKKLYEELLVSTELVDNQVMDVPFVGKVNVMLWNDWIRRLAFRLWYAELKRAIISFANETTHAD